MVGFPNKPMGFPTKNDPFGVFWGYHHLRKHPYISPLVGRKNATYIPLIVLAYWDYWVIIYHIYIYIYHRSHLFREPETAVELTRDSIHGDRETYPGWTLTSWWLKNPSETIQIGPFNPRGEN